MSEPVKKVRKETDGAIRNKTRTRQKMMTAVGTVIKKKGYAGLSAKNIIAEAGVDRKLITLYFGSMDGLIDEYFNSRDYWMAKVAPQVATILGGVESPGKEETIKMLELFFDEVGASDDLRSILSLEVSQYHPRLRELADNREAMGDQLLQQLAGKFENTDVNINAILALQVAGIYYLQLHAHINGSTFCNLDITKPEGDAAIKGALNKILSLAFADAERQQKK